MHPFPVLGSIDDGWPKFLNILYHVATTTAAALPFSTLGAQAGDVVVYSGSVASSVSLTATGFTTNHFTYNTGNTLATFGFKVLTPADIASPPLFQGVGGSVGLLLALYRGPNNAAFRGQNTANNSTSVTLTGFSPDANTRGVVALDVELNTMARSITAGFTQRVANTAIPMISDRLAGYGGGNITVTAGGNNWWGITALEFLKA